MSATVREETLVSGESGATGTARESESHPRGLVSFIGSDPASGYSGIEERSTPLHSFLEHSTLFVFPLLFSLNLYLGVTHLYELELLWLVALGIPLGVVLGDFVTGIVHWIGDTYFSEDTPIIGPGFVKPFRQHHVYPRDICTHNIVTTLGNSCIFAVPAMLACLYLLFVGPVSGWIAFTVLTVTILAIATVATNQFHKWAHAPQPSTAVRWLQQKRLVLEPSHHEVHHTSPHDSHYCITNGWLNPLLNKIRFFRGMERFLSFFGIKPARRA